MSIHYQSKIREFLKTKISDDFTYSDLEIKSLPLPSVVIRGLKSEQKIGLSFNIPKTVLYINPFNLFWNNNGLIWSARIESPSVEIRSNSSSDFVYNSDSFANDTIDSLVNYIPRFSTYAVPSKFKNLFKSEIKIHSIEIVDGSLSLYKSEVLERHLDDINIDSRFRISNNHILLKKSHLSALLEQDHAVPIVIGGIHNIDLYLSDSGFMSLIVDGSAFVKKDENAYAINPFNINSRFNLTDSELVWLDADAAYSLGGSLKIKDINLHISPFFSKNNLALLVSGKGDYQIEDKVIPLQLSTVIEARSDARAWSTFISLNNNSQLVELSMPKIEIKNEGVLSVSDSNLKLALEQINFKADFELANSKCVGNLAAQGLNFKILQEILSNFSLNVNLPKLVMTGNASFIYAVDELLLNSNQLNLAEIQYDSSNLTIQNAILKDLSARFNNFNLRDFSSKLEINNLKAQLAVADKYKVDKLSAAINLKHRKKYTLTGDLNMTNFGFADGHVNIQDVIAEMKKIKITYSDKDGVLAETTVSGNKMKLDTPDFSVNSLSYLSGPLKVSVDSKGKYSVQGKGDAKFADMSLFKKQILASGVVDFLITGPIKSFSTNNLSGTLNSRAFSLSNAAVDMTDSAYQINKSELEIYNGKINVVGAWGRGPNPYKLKLGLQDIDLTEFAQSFPEDSRPRLSGKFKKVDLDLKGKKGDLNSIAGSGNIIFEKGVLKSLELDSILGNPVIGAKETTEDPGTYVESLDIKFNMDNGLVNADNFLLAGKFYTFKGSGTYSLTEGFKVKGAAVYLEKTLSELGGPIKLLRELLGALIRVEIPVKIKGPIEDPVVEADLSRVMSILSPGRAVRSIGEGVGDILGGIKDVVTGK